MKLAIQGKPFAQGAAERTVALQGHLDADSSFAFIRFYEAAAAEGPADWVLDLSDLVYVSSAGLSSLLNLRSALNDRGGSLMLYGIRPRVRRAFHLLGMERFFRFESAPELPHASSAVFHRRFERPMDHATLDAVHAALTTGCVTLGLNAETAFKLRCVADELISNVIDHSDCSWFEVRLDWDPRSGRIRLTVTDDGRPFDVVEAVGYYDGPLVVDGLDRHLGFWMLRAYLRDLHYTRTEAGTNEATFSTLPEAPPPAEGA